VTQSAPSGPPTAPTSPPPPLVVNFSGEDAFAFARDQVLYPNGTVRHRVPGTPGNDEAASMIAAELARDGWNVTWDNFTAPYLCDNATRFHNVVGERAGSSGDLVILGAHYDTRPVADGPNEANATNRTLPIPGANDGASGVAVLLELARVLAGPTKDTVRLVFFDGEDSGDIASDPCHTPWLIGSSHYAASIPVASWSSVKAMVLVDLVGDPHLQLPKELLSLQGPGKLVQQRIYEVGGGLGYASIFTNDTTNSSAIEDDHQPFLEQHMPAVDLIHLVAPPAYFPEWHHTQHDDLAHVSAASLEAVGRTLQAWLESGQLSDPAS
jgi:Zn-dependent M28 family amino/carboxypeptidase